MFASSFQTTFLKCGIKFKVVLQKTSFSSSPAVTKEVKEPLVLKSIKNGVMTLTMNNPKRLNAWTKPMMEQLLNGMKEADLDSQVKACILTGKGNYYCAGVDLSGTLKPGFPQKVWNQIKSENQLLFDTFLDFKKPILIALNGPAIGASVTSATLCDGIIASETATLSTPFARLGIPPEGCSSVNFERIMGKEAAHKMLFENWTPTAQEAKKLGFIIDVVPIEQLQIEAQNVAEKWILDKKIRNVQPDLKEVNKNESEALASAFLSSPFLNAQYKFLSSKGKLQLAYVFKFMAITRPVWSMMLEKK